MIRSNGYKKKIFFTILFVSLLLMELLMNYCFLVIILVVVDSFSSDKLGFCLVLNVHPFNRKTHWKFSQIWKSFSFYEVESPNYFILDWSRYKCKYIQQKLCWISFTSTSMFYIHCFLVAVIILCSLGRIYVDIYLERLILYA